MPPSIMETDLFPECYGGGPDFPSSPLDGWMAEALKGSPDSDREALTRIPGIEIRRECFLYLIDFRQRGAAILAAMAEEVVKAIDLGRRGIGGIRLAGAIWNRGNGFELSNEAACFYVFVLSLSHPELAPYLASEGAAAEAMRKTRWHP